MAGRARLHQHAAGENEDSISRQSLAADIYAGCLGLPELCFPEEGGQSH